MEYPYPKVDERWKNVQFPTRVVTILRLYLHPKSKNTMVTYEYDDDALVMQDVADHFTDNFVKVT